MFVPLLIMQLRINRNNLINPLYIGVINGMQLKMRIFFNKIERAREVLTLRAKRGGAKTAGKGVLEGKQGRRKTNVLAFMFLFGQNLAVSRRPGRVIRVSSINFRTLFSRSVVV